MKKRIIVWFAVLLSFAGMVQAECPSMDITGDCKVNLEDFAVMAAGWLEDYQLNEFADLTLQWLEEEIPDPAGMVFVNIPGGTFDMGDHFNEGWPDERPVHTVTLSSFQMSKYEITNDQYRDYLNAALAASQITVFNNRVYAISDTSHSQPYFVTHEADSDSQISYNISGSFYTRSKNGRNMVNDPVVMVSWYGAKVFCDYYGYKLPTEAQWEYAARGGQQNPYYRFPWGNMINHDYANYRANGSAYSYDTSPYSSYTFHPNWNDGTDPYTAPVGSFPVNGYGLCDMTGNVMEWCSDWYSSSYYSSSPSTNPTGPISGSYRVVRGGHWGSYAYGCRVAYRGGYPGLSSGYYCGFRVCR